MSISYSRWDGSQFGFEVGADDVLDAMADELLYHGNLDNALRQLMRRGFDDRNGERIQGINELLERLRRERQERLEQFDLGGVYDEIAEQLRDVVDQERRSLDQMAEQAQSSSDERSQDLMSQTAAEKNLQLDLLPPDLAGQVRGLQSYEFTSSEAQQRFEELLDRLRQQLMQQMVDKMSGAVQGMSPEDMARMKDMLAALNEMLEQRARGEEPEFERFMENFGDFFPENPQTLDELLEVMAQRMAAMQQMLNSMTPAQRAQLQQLSDQLLEDMDLQWQVDQLGQNLRAMFPDLGWNQSQNFSGADPLDFSSAMEMMGEIGDLDQLERMLTGATNPASLAEVDTERIRELLGRDAANSIDRIAELTRMLEKAGYVQRKDGQLEMTARAIRRIGQQALGDIFRKLSQDRPGRHQIERLGIGHERAYETKPYEFGDPFNLDIGRTVRNAIRRRGGGTPVELSPDDFEVERTELTVRSSTVLMLDLSLSMPMRDNFLPAKKVAMALHALISSQYPRDYLGLITFAAVAHEIRAEDLPKVMWDYDYGTNMQHGLALARRMLSRQTGTKQIIMITDGEPTAHLLADGRPFFSYPPTRETVELTLTEAARCTRDGIRINTFMLDATSSLSRFVEQMSRLNGGRAFFTTNQDLGDYVLVDFVEQRRRMNRSARTA